MWIVIAVIAVILVVIVLIYNGLIVKKNRVANVFSTIDVMLKKRYDLVPQLVETVKGYVQHERGLLERITELRSKAAAGRMSDNDAVVLNNELAKLLSRLFVVVENYPQLKANENFMHLQRTLTELEEQLSAARRAFNAAVNDYKNAVEMFPTNIAASMMGYRRKDYFEIAEDERKSVDVNINLQNPKNV
jgi:LemA protein